ncbi:MAG: hypothetical protein KAG56_10380, partial [Sulfurovaceae bacterium]|nr:hypothetical protein [Sulfurovaceae bacterium]
MEENIKVVLELKEHSNEFELVTYLESLDTNELKEMYYSYYYAKEIEIENYNKTFLEYQEDSDVDVDYMLMELSQGKTLHALNHYLKNISEKIEMHEEEIEIRREEKYLKEEREKE